MVNPKIDGSVCSVQFLRRFFFLFERSLQKKPWAKETQKQQASTSLILAQRPHKYHLLNLCNDAKQLKRQSMHRTQQIKKLKLQHAMVEQQKKLQYK